jgi:hypothetical protein
MSECELRFMMSDYLLIYLPYSYSGEYKIRCNARKDIDGSYP